MARLAENRINLYCAASHLDFVLSLFNTFIVSATIVVLLALANDCAIAKTSGQVIRAGAEIDYPPFSIVTDDGKAVGFSVELMQAALAAMGKDVTFHTGPWDDVRGWLERGEIEALPLVGRTPEREMLFDFTVPYMSLHGAIVVRENETGIRDIADLHGRQVAVMKGDNAEEFLRRQKRDFAIQTTPSFEIALHELSEGRYDAVVIQRLVALRLIQQTGLTNLQVLEQPIEDFNQDFCFAVHEGDRETLAVLNEGLAIVVANGTYRQLHAKWFAEMQLPTNRPIVVGGDLNFPPFEFLDENGRPAGYNVDLTHAIARAMNINIEIRLGRWPERLEALKAGKIDALQGMFYSPERDQDFDFSQAHTVSHYVAVVRKGKGSAPETLEELGGKRIIVQRGDLTHDFLLKHGLESQITLVEGQEAALHKLRDEEGYDCALVPRIVALSLIENHGWKDLVLGKKPLLSSDYCYAAANGQSGLLAQFSEGLKILEQNGEYRRIHDKWLGVHQEYPVTFVTALRYSVMVIVPLLLISLLAFGWSWALRRQVMRKTAALRTSEEYQRAIITCSPVALYTIDMDGKVINWNQSAEKIFGWNAEEIIGMPLPIVPPESAEEFDSLRRQVVGDQEFFGKELMRLKKDGTVFPVSLSVAQVRNDRNEIIGILGAAADLTERKAFENQLEWNLRRNELLSEMASRLLQSDDPQALVTDLCQKVMEFIDCQAFFNFLEDHQQEKLHLNAYAGIPEDEAKKIEWLEHGVAICGCVAQSQLPLFCENILSREDDPLTDLVKSYGIQAYCCHPLTIQGRLIGTLSFGRRSAPFFEKKEIGFMAAVTNLVAIAMNRIETEQKLRDSEARFRMFAELAPLGIVISDERERTLYVNPRFTELFGYTMQDMPSVHQWWDLVYPDEFLRRRVKEEWEKEVTALQGTCLEISPKEYPVTCKDGSVRHIEFHMASNGNVNAVLFTDVTERKRAEEQRREGFDLLNNLARLVPGVIYQYQLYPDGRSAFLYSSPGISDIYEVTPEEVREDAAIVFRRIHPEDRDRVAQSIVESAATLETFVCEFRVVLPQQGVRWRWSQAQPQRLHDGSTLWHGIISDITDRKKAEKILRTSEEDLRESQRIAQVGSWRLDIATNEVVWTDELYRMYGFNPELPPPPYTEHHKLFTPESWDRLSNALQKTRETGIPYDLELETVRLDGSRGWMWVHGMSVLDHSGATIGLRGVVQDITERKQAEESIRESNEYLENLINNANVPIVVWDKEFRITRFNHAFEELTGKDRVEVLGKSVAMLFPADQMSSSMNLLQKTLNGHRLEHVEINIHHVGDSQRTLLLNSATIFEADRISPLAIIAQGYDITELKKAEEEKAKLSAQLQQSQKLEAIGTLAGGIAHDFNNILGAIVGYSEMVRDDLPFDSPSVHDINQVLKASLRAKELVKQILAFSRQLEDQKIPFQPAVIVKEAIALLRSSLPTTITIKQDIDPDVGMILADPTQIHQIIMNLATNAFHAMEAKGGTLTITLQKKFLSQKDLATKQDLQPGEFVQLSVEDTGEGILPEIRERIFDPFFTTKEVGKGTGLGLSMVYSIVKSGHGAIDCDSRLGEGTEFRIILPALEGYGVEEMEAMTPIPHGKEHILLIDDEEVLVELGQAMLKRLGYHVTTRTSSLEALATFQNQPDTFDLVITDQTMPGMTGVDLARRILQIRPGMPIILCTGYSSLITEDKVKAAGIKGFAYKPLARKDIGELIRKVLDGRKQ